MARNSNGKRHATPQSLNGAIRSICNIMRRSNCAGATQYVPELTWIRISVHEVVGRLSPGAV